MSHVRSEADPLIIRKLEFLGPMTKAGGWRPDTRLPEIAFCGRSNVGKSSLLNRLVNRKSFARVSRTPGRTREINFFSVNDEFVLADLPGYGYARVSKERKTEWKPLIEDYLRKSERLAGVVQLLDVRHAPSEDDLDMLEFLADIQAPAIVVFTKTDKLSRSAAANRVKELAAELGIHADQTIAFSAMDGTGRNELAEAIVKVVRTRAQ